MYIILKNKKNVFRPWCPKKKEATLTVLILCE